MNDEQRDPVDPAAAGEAAETFMTGLATAFAGSQHAGARRHRIEVAMNGSDLGLRGLEAAR